MNTIDTTGGIVSWHVVVAANQFTPSILTQLWLVKNQIVAEDEFEPGCIFVDQVTQIETKKFGLMMVPPFFQFAPKAGVENESGLVTEKVSGIVKHLSQVPYSAIGLNFAWVFAPTSPEINEFTKRLFFKKDGFLGSTFDSPDARYGGYFSKPFHDLRMKLDIKPIMHVADGKEQHRVQFFFNFHMDLVASPETVADDVTRALSFWDVAKSEAALIVSETIKSGVQ